jgi:hypothetical protein
MAETIHPRTQRGCIKKDKLNKTKYVISIYI